MSMRAGSISVVLTTLRNENYRRRFPDGKQAVNRWGPFREESTRRNAQDAARSSSACEADPVCAETFVDGGPAHTVREHIKRAANSGSTASPQQPGVAGRRREVPIESQHY